MDPRTYQRFSDLVKAIRRKHRMSQRAMAKALHVSPGYIGQWELRLSQPSAEVATKLCQIFAIADIEYVQRLAYAQRAPEWLRESIISYHRNEVGEVETAEYEMYTTRLSAAEHRIVNALRRLSDDQLERLSQRIEGWV
ncbi:MAG TPA: helix-turn-helix transcriptional regulator, partial [Myxococcota bacterium]|nr:helix-turn-helix transcriptional regulator [Myxococcota bacterium]